MKVFVTGISGFLGLHAALQWQDRYEVSGAYHAHPVELPGIRTVRLDATNAGAVRAALEQARPDVVVHTAALTNVDACETDPQAAHALHVTASRAVAEAAQRIGARLVHISTDHLFSGQRPWMTEAEAPAPVNVYARTKWEAEQAVQAADAHALIVRTNFFGWGVPRRPSSSDWVVQGLRQGRELPVFTDVHFTPILVNTLVDLLAELIERKTEGVWHVAGRERVSKAEFAQRLARAFGLPERLLKPARLVDRPLAAPRPADLSLNTDRIARLLGRPMPGLDEGFNSLQALEQAGWPARLAAASMAPAPSAR